MFKSKTVVVVGAGASAECNMPTGDALKRSIAEALRFSFDFDRLKSGDHEILDVLKVICRDENLQINTLVHACRQLSSTIDTFPSIDEALHWWRDNKDIVSIGKIAISKIILAAERQSTLAPERGMGGLVNVANASGAWLRTFLSMCLSGCDRASVSRAFDNITFINFNYDRIIEQYIYWALQQNGGVGGDVAASTVASLNILRPYGSLGALDWVGRHEVDFGASRIHNIRHIADNIRTFTEQVEGLDIIPLIDAALHDAQLLLFLGFGFHQQNLQLFKVQKGSSRSKMQRVFATAYGVDVHNYGPLTQKLEEEYGLYNIDLMNLKADQLLVNMRPTIAMVAS